MIEWFSCKNIFPPCEGYYLATLKSGIVRVVRYRAKQKAFYECGMKAYKMDVIALAVLPQAYREVSDAV